MTLEEQTEAVLNLAKAEVPQVHVVLTGMTVVQLMALLMLA